MIDLADDLEVVNEYFHNHAWTDGLPIVPPTEERVRRMLAGTKRNHGALVARVPMRYADATVEVIAINAVMAGCLPEHMPLLIAAVEALCDPALNVHSVQATTSTAAIGAVINGPIADDLGINYKCNALGCGHRSNASIGRALRFILTTVGGGIPGLVDMSTHGQPGKHTLCFAEHESASPWGPLHVTRGFRPEENAVTLFAFEGTNEIVDAASDSAEGVLTTIAGSMTSVGNYGERDILGGGEPLVLFCPEHARIVARGGFDRRDAQRFLFDRARVPVSSFAPKVVDAIRAYRRTIGPGDIEADVRVATSPEDILILVVGGDGAKSTFIPTWTGGTRAVTRRIEDRCLLEGSHREQNDVRGSPQRSMGG